MAFCSNCGGKIEDGVKFCSGCGAPIGSAAVEIKQEKAVNFIQAMPSVSTPANLYQKQDAQMVQALAADEKYCFSCGSPIKKIAEICVKCGVNQSNRNISSAADVYCASCGKTIKKEASICPFCGVAQQVTTSSIMQQQPAMPQPQSAMADEKYCFSCGSITKKIAEICPKCGVNQNSRGSVPAIDVYCTACGKSIKKAATTCPFCGVKQGTGSSKSWTVLLVLWFIGVHRFYAGKIGTGILYIFTGAGMLIWAIIDLIIICTDKFTDKNGEPIQKN